MNRFILYSDIAGSSRLADAYQREYSALLDQHNALVLQAVSTHGGQVYKNLGDGYIALFETARACADCAVMLQCALGELPPLNPSGAGVPAGHFPNSASVPLASGEGQGPRAEGQGEESVGRAAVPATTTERLLVRIALHGGELRQSEGEYFGPALNRASRICQVISGGQVVASTFVVSGLGGAGAQASRGGAVLRPLDVATITDLGEHHLRDLAEPEHLYQLDHPGFAQHDFPPLATLNNRPNNLVEQPNRFIGRVKELAELEGLLVSQASALAGQSQAGTLALPDTGEGARAIEGGMNAAPTGTSRLLTIIAPGGYGKSRIAAQLCANLLPQFERGCFMVYLAPVREALDVPFAIGQALGYQFSAGRTPEQQLCDYLRNKEMLLCLDNMEHVLERAPLVAEFLKAAPKVKVVITSREPLRIQGEVIYRLEPLPTRAAGGNQLPEAVRLFADRAALVNPGFTLDSNSTATVLNIAEQLSGIPLAIELAAAWMDGFTLGELQEELGQQLEIEARSSDVEARHQSLKACLDWSWNLLGEAQQEMLMRLSVFRGGFFADAASAVLNAKGMALRGALLKLCDKSWLYTREVDAQTRFFLRDMLAHEYAFKKLEATQESSTAWTQAPVPAHEGRQAGAPAATRQTSGAARESSLYESAVCAHAAYFAALAEREGPRLAGGGTPDGGKAQMQALRIWRIELANIEEALDSAMKRGKAEWLIPISEHLQRCYTMSGSLLAQRVKYSQLHVAAEVSGNPEYRIQAGLGLGVAQWRLSQYHEASATLSSSLELACESGDRRLEAASLANLGAALFLTGDYGRSMERSSQALAIQQEIGDRKGVAGSVLNLALAHHAQSNYTKAKELLGQALAIKREIGDRHGEALSIVNMAGVHGEQGELARATELLREALPIYREIGDRLGEAHCLSLMTNNPLGQGEFARAGDLCGQALEIQRDMGDRRGEAFSLLILGNIQFSQDNFEGAASLQSEALAIYRQIGDRQGEANALTNLGTAQYTLGDYARAAEQCKQALAIYRGFGGKNGICHVCVIASPILTALPELHVAATALFGRLAQNATASFSVLDSTEQRLIDDARARLDSAVAAGEITAEQLAVWQAEGEAMSLDELADFVQAALAEVAAGGDVDLRG